MAQAENAKKLDYTPVTYDDQYILMVNQLKKYFPIKGGLMSQTVGHVKAVDGVTFNLKRGHTMGLVGESGCGKSTTGRTILRLIEPTEGEIYFEGENLCSLDAEAMRQKRRDMQLVFQDPYSSLNPRMTVRKLLEEPLITHFKLSQDELNERVLWISGAVGISPEQLDRYPHQFSGGQRQRIGIARSLAVKPKFVVCDEAVSALDVSIQSQIINLLADLKDQSNLTYLFITHDLSVVKYISDRVGVMYLGNMVELADTQEIFDHPLHPYTEALMAAIPTTDVEEHRELRILEGDIPSPVNPPQGCKFHTRCAHCTEICKHAVPEWKEMAPGHFVACHHPLGGKE